MRSLLALLLSASLLGTASFATDDLPRRGLMGVAVGVTDDSRGVAVVRVFPDTSAEKAGLEVGDRIVEIEGQRIDSPIEFSKFVGKHKSGAVMDFVVERKGKKRSIAVTLIPFPQESYEKSRVNYGHVTLDDGSRLRTITTIPTEQDESPAVLILQGLDCGSIDRPLGVSEKDSFMGIVQHLAESGFVTMRVEKSGVADSEGPPCSEIDFDTELAGYAKGLRALRKMKSVDKDAVFLLGFSMGGVMAPFLASEQPVRGVGAYGTITKGFLEYMVENRRRQLPRQQQDALTAEDGLRAYQEFWSRVLLDQLTPAETIERYPHLKGTVGNIDDTHFFGRHVSFFHQLQAKRIPQAWSKVKGTVLAIHGEYDWVSAKDDHERIPTFLSDSSRGRFVPLRGYDHLGTVHDTLLGSYANYGQGEIDDRLATVIETWLREAS